MRKKLGGLLVLVLVIISLGKLHDVPEQPSDYAVTDTASMLQWIEDTGKVVNTKFDQIINDALAAFGYSSKQQTVNLKEQVVSKAANAVRTTVDALAEKAESEAGNGLKEAKLLSVVDGDTIWVELDGEKKKVRLLTVNTEESVSSDQSKNNRYGKLASKFAKNFLSKYETVYLEYDEQTQDIYGRQLCYVWLDNDVDTENISDIKKEMYNAILLKKGYAYTVVYEPNHKNADIFKKIEKSARKEKTGLWKYKKFQKLANEKQK